ncbi:MAG TPA: cytochrome c oxidase assembly protein [Nocardioides sp.]|uniref:cytochrome c oxidase assembly protein n=1 Tax=Nocardioides sp. TaxID=35761 RepID=UPI002F3F4FAB
MTLRDWLTSWSLSAVPTTAVVVTGILYAAAWHRVPFRTRGKGRAVPRSRAWCFAGGLLALVVAVDGPPDVFAESSFSLHMVQHVLLQMVAAPLLLLGGPVSVLLRADPPWLRRRMLVRVLRSRLVTVVTHPLVALAAFAVVLVVTHLTSLYEMALEHEPVHQVEHLVYLVTALMFWWPAVGVDPAPRRIGHPVRVFYLMISMPATAFLGLAIANAGHLLYSSYAHPTPWGTSPLADQQAAGTLMWVAGMFTIAPAIGVVLMRWLDDEARQGDRRPGLTTPPNHLAGAR